MKPDVKAFFDEATFTVSSVVKDPEGDSCAIIHSVLDFDPKSGRTNTKSTDEIKPREPDLDIELLLMDFDGSFEKPNVGTENRRAFIGGSKECIADNF